MVSLVKNFRIRLQIITEWQFTEAIKNNLKTQKCLELSVDKYLNESYKTQIQKRKAFLIAEEFRKKQMKLWAKLLEV